MGMIEDDSTIEVPVLPDDDSPVNRDLAKWQIECIRAAKRKLPGFLVTEPLPIRQADCGKFWGLYHGGSEPWIAISAKCYAAGKTECKKTILHEILHAHIARTGIREPSHGETFQKLALVLGLKGFGERNWRFKYTCRKCGYWLKSHTKYVFKPTCRYGHGEMGMRRNVVVHRHERRALSDGSAVLPKAPHKPRDLVAERAARAEANLKAWERKLKLAETKVKHWRRKVAYYERVAVRKE